MKTNAVIDSGCVYLEPMRKYSASYRIDSKLEMAESEYWSVFTEMSRLLEKAEKDGFPPL